MSPAMAPLPLAGTRVLVVGTGKPGVATAAHARAAGAEVTLSGRSGPQLAAATLSLPGVTPAAADPEDPDQAVELLERLQPLDHVAVLAGGAPLDGRGFWGSLHGAIEALGRNAAFELAPLRVNTVSPGGVDVSPMSRQPVDHPGQRADVASMVVSLMAVPGVTGTVVDVDGGEYLGGFE
ncbi:hypothetical protein [Amycolatopsis magusensis]|uniref:hypothetical protein n=1 Tax=Amycolatopsis magusensis TaxID=882444 RepID=UPI0037971804